MQCKIDGCGKSVHFKAEQLCQMHYFRHRRYGTFDLTRKPALQRRMHTGGYVLVHSPGHPLAQENNYVYEHRKVMYDKYGESLPPCELCGKPSSWATTPIDHIDRDRTNNIPSNLRPLCVSCNTWRDMPHPTTFKRCTTLTFDGKTDTPHGWSRDPRVIISANQIRLRKKGGMSDYDALFSPKLTHGRKAANKPAEPKRMHQP